MEKKKGPDITLAYDALVREPSFYDDEFSLKKTPVNKTGLIVVEFCQKGNGGERDFGQ